MGMLRVKVVPTVPLRCWCGARTHLEMLSRASMEYFQWRECIGAFRSTECRRLFGSVLQLLSLYALSEDIIDTRMPEIL